MFPKNERTNFSCKLFASSVASASKKFQSRQIPSAPGMFLRPASRVCQKIKPPISRICPSFFKILESSCFATKDNYCLPTLLISVHLQAGRSFYDKWSTSLSRFCLFSRFCSVFIWDKSCRRCVWRFIRLGQNLSNHDKPSALAKCWWWQKTTYSLVLGSYW